MRQKSGPKSAKNDKITPLHRRVLSLVSKEKRGGLSIENPGQKLQNEYEGRKTKINTFSHGREDFMKKEANMGLYLKLLKNSQ